MKKLIYIIVSIFLIYIGYFLFFKNTETHSVIKDDITPSTKVNKLDNAINLSSEEKAKKLLKSMTLEEKVGQMFFARCRANTAIDDIKKYYLGGYILFDNDIKNEDKKSLSDKIKTYQNSSKIKLLIGVDEEGGSVNRISDYTNFRETPFLSPSQLYEKGGFTEIMKDTKEKSSLLKSLGINVNLAPVADVSTNNGDYIYSRTFKKDASETAEYIKNVVTGMKQMNLGSVLKHFPGYGNNINTHTDVAVDNRSYETFVNSDFLPFKAGIKAGADSIMVSHNIVNSMDSKLPASLSQNVHKILRDKLNFEGVIMTDDLQMDAIKKAIGDSSSAILAIKAGNDLIISSDFDVQIPTVLESIKRGDISQDLIDKSVLRILKWKFDLGIIK